MPVNPRMRAQTELILDSLDSAAAFPHPDRWEQEDVGDVDYLYRHGMILVRERDADRVTDALGQLFGGGPADRQRVTAGVLRITLPPVLRPVPEVLDRLDEVLGRHLATPDTVHYVCPHPCPADEPGEVPLGTVDPFPAPGLNERCCQGHRSPGAGCDGDGVVVSIVDTGLWKDAAIGHPWLAGVEGAEEHPYDKNGIIHTYAGHGTFVAGCLRCAAPRASVYVEKAFEVAAAVHESELAASLENALDKSPDILLFSSATSSRL